MSPRRGPARREDSSDNHTLDSNSAATNSPSWDSSPNTLPSFIADLKPWFPRDHTHNRSMIAYGLFLNSRGQMVVSSDNHMDRHYNGLLTKGTFEKPCIITATDFVAIPTGSGSTNVLLSNNDAADAAARKTYFVSPTAIQQEEARAFEDIAACIDDAETVEDLRATCLENGLLLIQELRTLSPPKLKPIQELMESP